MSDDRTNPPELVIRPTTLRSQWAVLVGVLLLAVVFHVVQGVELVREGRNVVSVMIYVGRVLLTVALAFAGAGIEPTRVRISSDGMTWYGPGWIRHRPWSDLAEVASYRHDLGAGGTWIAARLTTDARRASGVVFPRRLLRTSLHASDEVAGLVRLTSPSWYPGWPGRRKPATPRPVWDVADEQIVDAVRAHVGDRWVDELGPVDPP